MKEGFNYIESLYIPLVPNASASGIMGLFLDLAWTFGLKFPALTTKTLTTEVIKCFLNNVCVCEHWEGKTLVVTRIWIWMLHLNLAEISKDD